jgi:RES domain
VRWAHDHTAPKHSAPGTELYRITHTHFPDRAYFGRGTLHRFDAPDGSYGVCYLATSLACALLETLPVMHRPSHRPHHLFERRQLSTRYAAIATTMHPLKLAHLADDGLTQLGIDQRHTGGDDYDLSGAWSSAIHRHPANPHGILYPSRHHNGLYNIALFDSAAGCLHFDMWGTLGDPASPDLWTATAEALDRFTITLI